MLEVLPPFDEIFRTGCKWQRVDYRNGPWRNMCSQ